LPACNDDRMRLLLASDIHRNLDSLRSLVERAESHDALLIAGDLDTQHQGLDEIAESLSKLATPTAIVPGNNETADALRAAMNECCPNAAVLHGEKRTVGGLNVFGLGGGIPPIGASWSFDLTEDDAAAELTKAEPGVDVLLLHSPPLGAADRTGEGKRIGSTSIRDAIRRVQPALAVCGHVHPSWGTVARVGETVVVNPGPRGLTFETVLASD